MSSENEKTISLPITEATVMELGPRAVWYMGLENGVFMDIYELAVWRVKMPDIDPHMDKLLRGIEWANSDRV